MIQQCASVQTHVRGHNAHHQKSRTSQHGLSLPDRGQFFYRKRAHRPGGQIKHKKTHHKGLAERETVGKRKTMPDQVHGNQVKTHGQNRQNHSGGSLFPDRNPAHQKKQNRQSDTHIPAIDRRHGHRAEISGQNGMIGSIGKFFKEIQKREISPLLPETLCHRKLSRSQVPDHRHQQRGGQSHGQKGDKGKTARGSPIILPFFPRKQTGQTEHKIDGGKQSQHVSGIIIKQTAAGISQQIHQPFPAFQNPLNPQHHQREHHDAVQPHQAG